MLSVTSEYALRALACLAESESTKMLGHNLARRSHVPNNYLSKIMIVLRNAGIVEASRGVAGGYSLRRLPREIRILHVVELFENDTMRSGCLLDRKLNCSDQAPCMAHAAWREARQTCLHFLESTTLADITTARSRAAPVQT